MSELLRDHEARARFRREWQRNFAVSANAGAGKTTAISERLAEIALASGGAELLPRTAVVTFTKKAAAQIGQRARAVLVRRLAEERRADHAPLDHLERAFFGTIHSFCLLLAQRHGQALGLNLNPAVVADDDDALWDEFLEQDAMEFHALAPEQVDAFLRHAPLDAIFALARRLDAVAAHRLVAARPAGPPPDPAAPALARLLAATSKGKGAVALQANQECAQEWWRRFRAERGYLPIPKPQGKAAGVVELFAEFFAPVKAWLADAGAALAGELALRYREWRFERGVQTYADQVEAALAVLHEPATLERIRAEGWRVILDEAQDTDPQQFAVLVEVTRPPGAELGTWPQAGGAAPRAGHFCLVGDGQQGIYGSRADIRNFQRHLEAFARGDGGELLKFEVTFRAPEAVIGLLNATLPDAFGAGREHNLGLPPAPGAPEPLLQVPYEPLAAGPKNVRGAVVVLPLVAPGGKLGVDAQLAAEARQVAAFLRAHGPGGVGARDWGEVCVLAPRNDWLLTARKEFEAAGLKTSLQMRKNRNGDNPAYASITALLAAVCDPENTFEWVGVLREIFTVSDAEIAVELRRAAPPRFQWDTPEEHAPAVSAALECLRPFVTRVDEEGAPLERFATDLVRATALADKLRLIDPSGGLNGELERLLAHAATLGLEGAGPRAWLRELLAAIDDGRPAGKASPDAINLLTSHSAKGLEWGVVIPLGLWRPIGKRDDTGLRMLPDAAGRARVYFDSDSLPEETKAARERERRRELVRLLYVTLTRPRRTLVLPWGANFAEPKDASFLALWGADLAGLPRLGEIELELPVADAPAAGATEGGAESAADGAAGGGDGAGRPVPRRVLPHQLSHQPDAVRTARHESSSDEPVARSTVDPLEYGTWWHGTLEFLPWGGAETELAAYLATAEATAQAAGFGERARAELARLRGSEAWRELQDARWRRLAELSVVAPLEDHAWVDGVIDLVAHDEARDELLVVDWKTNLRRRGESDESLLARLRAEYEPQLEAYRRCLAQFFPGAQVQLALYATDAGVWCRW